MSEETGRSSDGLEGQRHVVGQWVIHLNSEGALQTEEGEVLQLQAQHQPETTEETYLKIIHGKTSRLFELATEGAAILAGTEEYREPYDYKCRRCTYA